MCEIINIDEIFIDKSFIFIIKTNKKIEETFIKRLIY